MLINKNLPIHQIAQEEADNTAVLTVTYSFLISIFPHFFHMPLWVTGFTFFAVAWRSAQSLGYVGVIPKWMLVPLVVVGGVSVFAQYWTIVGRDPGLALLTVMTAFKFLESKTHRDILILIFLCYFLLATHFLFGQSILIAVYMFVTLIIITSTLITINQRDDSIPLKYRLKSASRLIGLSIPIMIILFVLVPRIPGPLWGLTPEQRGGITGLSDTMSPGAISSLIRSNEVAFRVTFEDSVPAQHQLYWRGPVMVNFNGRTWSQQKHKKVSQVNKDDSLVLSRYTITLEPNGKKWLFGLDIPVQTPSSSYMNTEYQLTSSKPVNDLKRYTISSLLDYRMGMDDPLEYLILADTYHESRNPQTLALGQQWSKKFNSDIEIVDQALYMFRNQEFIYTLHPPSLGKHSSDEFLFQTRRGFCEHYASSFALLMRAAGIPSRVVTGYQGGELNQVGNYLIVRQSDAHAWTEVWLEDKGWVRVDPTAAVSPDRIEQGLDQALPESFSNFKIGKHSPFLSKLMYNWDNLQHNWNNMILNYDHRKQGRFLNQLGLGIRSSGDMIIAMVLCLVLITGTYWIIARYRERPASIANYEKIINRLLKKLSRSGFKKEHSEHVYEFLNRIKLQQDFQDSQLDKIFETYSKIKYARGMQQEVIIKRFQKMVSDWKVPN
ncbi:MAG: DUF3488 domain-containing transglutaminase family protein [Gammaproteobacteria bacterium]|jgi:transglutaminase-like putative cysteine protease|nr:DUF3488 domain-containing transglutaminase family protein [Gammaproteobacteria bacterium]MBT3723792.1 DUF3488 domain-containing transglutaminase family protein [Gammaproteobacteria bacterium]MBT4196414.1 DUF3488 domain-containing transglutaminase family protein [Gammaproteobacteria bacterium]MBT4448165.1 DUF3488 domain-containing transglutaminase family protein [Gammaproteobacteria bacterium]MBT4859878.1 DUF3488 domain-containing transglutaminase family protein [Gammaproteobacteria bacterium